MKREVLAPIGLGALLLIGWALTAGSGSVLLPTPGAVASRLVADLTDPQYWGYLLVTLAESFGGALLGAAVAMPMAIVIHRSAGARRPSIRSRRRRPSRRSHCRCWCSGWTTGCCRSRCCALIVFFPILISAVVGLKHVDADVVDAGRIDASSVALLSHVELPMALPKHSRRPAQRRDPRGHGRDRRRDGDGRHRLRCSRSSGSPWMPPDVRHDHRPAFRPRVRPDPAVERRRIVNLMQRA